MRRARSSGGENRRSTLRLSSLVASFFSVFSLARGKFILFFALGRSFVLVCFYEPFGRWPDGSLPSVLDGEGGWGKRPRACGEAPLFLAFGFGGSIDRSIGVRDAMQQHQDICMRRAVCGRCRGRVFFFFARKKTTKRAARVRVRVRVEGQADFRSKQPCSSRSRSSSIHACMQHMRACMR